MAGATGLEAVERGMVMLLTGIPALRPDARAFSRLTRTLDGWAVTGSART
jgi:hypothetical protein